MKKAVTAIMAVAMLATVPLAASTQPAAAIHKQWHKGLATGIGVGVGLGIVGALTRPRQQQVIVQQPAPVYVQPAPVVQGFSQAHYQECYRRAPNSYNPQTNTFVGYDGRLRVCYTPY